MKRKRIFDELKTPFRKKPIIINIILYNYKLELYNTIVYIKNNLSYIIIKYKYEFGF